MLLLRVNVVLAGACRRDITMGAKKRRKTTVLDVYAVYGKQKQKQR